VFVSPCHGSLGKFVKIAFEHVIHFMFVYFLSGQQTQRFNGLRIVSVHIKTFNECARPFFISPFLAGGTVGELLKYDKVAAWKWAGRVISMLI
jgi:hypothetical protein